MVKYNEAIINAQNEKIKEAYTELGELYYKAHKDDAEPEFEAPFSKIKAAQQAIEQHKLEVLKQNGLMLCKHCGCEILDISRFCNFCGKPVESAEEAPAAPAAEESAPEAEEIAPEAEEPAPEAAEEEKPGEFKPLLECPYCDAPVDEDFDFCTNCGKRIRGGANPEIPGPDASAPAAKDDVCPACGAKLNDDSIFCEECGTRVRDAENQPVNPAPSAPKEKRCPLCGFTTSDDDVNFCVECGSKLQVQ